MIVLLTYFLDCYRENKLISFHIRKLVSLTVVLLQGFPDSSVGKESTCNAGDPSHIPRLGRSAGEGIGYPLQYSWASLVAQLVKNLRAMQETWVRSLGWEDPFEKASTLAWRISWTIYSPWGHRVGLA